MTSSAPLKLCKRLLTGIAIAVLCGCTSLLNRPSNYETVSIDPSHDAEAAGKANRRATDLLAKDKAEKAEAQLRKALAADVTYGPAHNNLGLIYYGQGKYYLAAWEFEYAIKLMNDQPEPYNNLGLVLEAVGKLDDAIAAYETARRLQPDHPQYVGNLARARFRRSNDDPCLHELLSDLIVIDTRPDWVGWARERLALDKTHSPSPKAPLSSGNAKDSAGTTVEIIPPPQPENARPLGVESSEN